MEFLRQFFILSLLFTATTWAADIPLPKKYEKCSHESDMKILDQERMLKVEKLVGRNISSAIYKLYIFDCGGKISKAYLLSDKIRTHYQSLLIEVANHLIEEVFVLKFSEPTRYMPPEKWLKSFHGKNVKELMRLDALSGATLTRNSTIDLARRVLYLEKN